ncbi:hypothetical protein ACFQZO_23940 [Bradyrhizobium sp. GCM10027634]|uniref:hypothetical protein n=1 Tax=unclassified Bradyrhizobium TaxID=2631580 RepID=UPI00188B4BB2|nr:MULTISPECIES: hypothetical protein [unclassified Bradyrhizobium]MDN5003892.1 hypothetical protein [Bradyrhizobium sp. WYCCWR 12677]QOZ45446.1 hypothetical protein XH89_19610 [Bradyrhizobium sp. CCBAU 53340]
MRWSDDTVINRYVWHLLCRRIWRRSPYGSYRSNLTRDEVIDGVRDRFGEKAAAQIVLSVH